MTTVNTSGRFVGDWPKIGIRPAVDGRQHGVRESLEEQTRNMALRTADLIRANLRYPDGTPVEVVVPDHNIGGVYEAAKVAELFRKEGVGVSLTITPCWCYGSETMDMDPLTPKAVWGFNGTERPGAVYLAAVLAAHTQKGLPAFGIYGRDVQDAGDGTIPADVQAKILRFARAGLAAAILRGKSYLAWAACPWASPAPSWTSRSSRSTWACASRPSTCPRSTAGSRRGSTTRPSSRRASPGPGPTAARAPIATRPTRPRPARSSTATGRSWSRWRSSRATCMVGNPRLAELGFGEEALGRNAILGGFQGQRAVDRPQPQRRLHGGDPQLSASTGTGSAPPYMLATENDSLNGVDDAALLPADQPAQIFADVRTYWSAEAVERVTGHRLDGPRRGRLHPPHQLRRGHAGRHRRDDGRRRQAGHEAVLGDHRRRRGGSARGHDLVPGQPRLLPRRRLLQPVRVQGRNARHHGSPQPRQRDWGPCSRSPRAGPWTCPRRSTTSSTSGPTPPGPPTGSCRGPRARASSATSTR